MRKVELDEKMFRYFLHRAGQWLIISLTKSKRAYFGLKWALCSRFQKLPSQCLDYVSSFVLILRTHFKTLLNLKEHVESESCLFAQSEIKFKMCMK